jgi:membrane protein YqaA with SNARE-associated domain
VSTEPDKSSGRWWPPNRALRTLYDWTLHWADTPYGLPALALVAFAESSFFLIPPDLLLIALGAGRPKRAFLYATIATVCSVLGGLLGYLLGAMFMETLGNAIVNFYHLQEQFDWVSARYHEAVFWAVFTAGLTPIPYKVFTIAAGAVGISIPAFVLASILGRGTRFFAVGALLYFFGPPVRSFIDRYFDRLAILFTILLIAGFLLLKMAFR